jgi:uncharacterized protein involved in outer membrane biogenesis
MKKIIIRIVIGLVVLAVAGLICAMMFLDSMIKTGVETVGPKVAKVEMKLDSVSLSLFSGGGSVKGLVIGNPEGYKTATAIQVGSASLSLQPASLLSDKIIIKSVNVQAPEITFETDFKKSNLTKIQDNIQEFLGASQAKTNQADSGKPAKKLQVDEFIISGAKLHLSLTALGGKTATVPLPDIHLTDLGKGPEGITGGELFKVVLGAIEKEAVTASTSVVSDLKNGALYIGKEAVSSTSNALNKIGKGVSDLFKKK